MGSSRQSVGTRRSAVGARCTETRRRRCSGGPRLLVCLGATAAQALLGRKARVTALRGRVLEPAELDLPVVVTLHPSAVVRAGARREELRSQLADDLALARNALEHKRVETRPPG